MMRYLTWLLAISGLGLGQIALADEPAKLGGPESTAKSAKTDFDKGFSEWKDLLSRLRDLQVSYRKASGDEKTQLAKEFGDLVVKGREMEVQLTTKAEKAFSENPESSSQAAEFLLGIVGENTISRDNFEIAAPVSKLLIEKGYKRPELYDLAGIDAFCTNDFAAAEKDWNIAAKAGVPPSPLTKKFQPSLQEYKTMWAKEEAIRAAEAKADDLPRVLLETTQGPITIELFENEAPNTVANFVHLVETKYYDGLKFHRVLEHFMAQGGDPTGTGSGGPGYKIKCECDPKDFPNHRNHFRGTLSMAHAGKDTGGSQFFLTFVPTPHLNGKHTAFGRVIEGMDVLGKLERIDPQNPRPGVEPDKILKATVIRKRNHPYEPKKVS